MTNINQNLYNFTDVDLSEYIVSNALISINTRQVISRSNNDSYAIIPVSALSNNIILFTGKTYSNTAYAAFAVFDILDNIIEAINDSTNTKYINYYYKIPNNASYIIINGNPINIKVLDFNSFKYKDDPYDIETLNNILKLDKYQIVSLENITIQKDSIFLSDGEIIDEAGVYLISSYIAVEPSTEYVIIVKSLTNTDYINRLVYYDQEQNITKFFVCGYNSNSLYTYHGKTAGDSTAIADFTIPSTFKTESTTAYIRMDFSFEPIYLKIYKAEDYYGNKNSDSIDKQQSLTYTIKNNLLTIGVAENGIYYRNTAETESNFKGTGGFYAITINDIVPNTKYYINILNTEHVTQNQLRFLIWMNNNTYINGYSYLNIPIMLVSPNNANKCIITFVRESDNTAPLDDYSFSTLDTTDTEILNSEITYLNQDINIHESQIIKEGINAVDSINKFTFFTRDTLDFCQHRRCTINFQFDDNLTTDDDIVDVFKEYNYRCGFAIIYNDPNNARFPICLQNQLDGFEMLSHSVNSTNQNSMEEADAIASIKNSYLGLTELGFIINGWVTPSSNMPNKYIPYLKKYYSYACTKYYGAYTGANPSYYTLQSDPYLFGRISIEASTYDQIIAAIDSAVQNTGFINIMGHTSGLANTENEFSIENMANILQYIRQLENNGDIICLTPWEALKYYYHRRWNE